MLFYIYPSSLSPLPGVCIIHDLSNNRQSFFSRHTDNVSCLAVSRDGTLAASGQVGRRPSIYVWKTESDKEISGVITFALSLSYPCTLLSFPGDLESSSFITSLGEGFFERSVCCVEFSPDNTLVVGIGEDDHHKLGIWAISSGLLLIDGVCQNGLPPQIKGLAWAPTQQHTGPSLSFSFVLSLIAFLVLLIEYTHTHMNI